MRLQISRSSWRSWEGIIDVAAKDQRLAQLRRDSERPDLWEHQESAQQTLQELSRLETAVAPYHRLHGRLEDAAVLAELAASEEDPTAHAPELEAELSRARIALRELEMADILSGEHDHSNAIIEINAGAGGTDACDWVTMLLRMYLRWAEQRGFKTEILDETPGDVAGLKSVTVHMIGSYAYGHLKAERGIHRLVRISPFDANRRRQTSFAAVDVVPEIEAAEEVEIDPDDLRIDTFRSSGAGGQNVQKNETAVRIKHEPTGIVVSCQNERSQLKNRDFAMKVLQSRLAEVRRKEQEAKMSELRGEQRAIEWGNHFRSYVFQPYTMVKDHRTNAETGNIIAVMDGEIDPLIHAYLTQFRGER